MNDQDASQIFRNNIRQLNGLWVKQNLNPDLQALILNVPITLIEEDEGSDRQKRRGGKTIVLLAGDRENAKYLSKLHSKFEKDEFLAKEKVKRLKISYKNREEHAEYCTLPLNQTILNDY